MLKVQIFSSDKQKDLQDQVNNFISNIREEQEVIDVKFALSMAGSSDDILFGLFAAMVIVKTN